METADRTVADDLTTSVAAIPVAVPEDATKSQVDSTEAHRIAAELVRLHAAGVIKDAEDPQASFYANLVQRFEASFTGVHFYPDYATTGSFNRRLTWNPKTGQWQDTSEPGFTCDPTTVPNLPSLPSMPLPTKPM